MKPWRCHKTVIVRACTEIEPVIPGPHAWLITFMHYRMGKCIAFFATWSQYWCVHYIS